MSGYLEYMDLLAGASGRVVDPECRRKAWAKQGIVTVDFDWDHGYSTTWVKDGKPLYARYYIWSGDDSLFMGWLKTQYGDLKVLDRRHMGGGHFAIALGDVHANFSHD